MNNFTTQYGFKLLPKLLFDHRTGITCDTPIAYDGLLIYRQSERQQRVGGEHSRRIEQGFS